MIKELKAVCTNFTEAFVGGFIAGVIFAFCKALLVHHELGFDAGLWLSILVYTLIYSFLFAMLHLGGKPNLRSTCFTAFTMVVLTCAFSFADEKFVNFNMTVMVGQFVFALMLTGFTYVFNCKKPWALGRS